MTRERVLIVASNCCEYPPPPPEADFGHAYKTRFKNPVPLIRRDTAAVEPHLVPFGHLIGKVFTEALYEPGELPYCGHRLTLELLILAQSYMWERVRRYAERNGIENPVEGQIALTGFFRPLGTSWGTGKFFDPFGCIDAYFDNNGHWKLAVDVSRQRTRVSFHPNLAADSVDKCMRKAGLILPFSTESWHWRPKRALREAYARGEYEFQFVKQ